MLELSDYSGSGIEPGFMEYLTGYPLANSNLYVFAKTWYADEMNRPGCVWTHSFLIDFTDLWSIRDFESLESLFRRPKHSEQGDLYSEEIEISSTDTFSLPVKSDVFRRLSSELYNSTDESIVLLAKESNDYTASIFNVWCLQWPRLKRNFKFSTGCLSLRFYDSIPFDLQVMPYNRERSVKFNDKTSVRILDLNDKSTKKLPDLATSNYSIDSLLNFMVRFGSDVPGIRSNYLSLYRGFALLTKKQSTIDVVIDYLSQNFTSPKDAKSLKAEIVEQYLNSNSLNKAKLLKFILNSDSFKNINWTFHKIIVSLWKSQELNDEDIVELINHLNITDGNPEVVRIIAALPMTVWISANLTVANYSSLFIQNPKLIGESNFWKLKVDSQDRVFAALTNIEGISWPTVVHAMLHAHSDRFANSVLKIRKDKLVDDLVTWVVLNDRALTSRWEEILIKYSKQLFINISSRTNLSREIFRLSNRVFLIDSIFWSEIPLETVNAMAHRFHDRSYEPEVTGFYLLIITIAFENRFKDSDSVSVTYFQDLHDRMMKNTYHRNSWERFKWCMGGTLFRIIENNYDSKHFDDRNNIPDWDRCEFLRRALLVSFLRYKWDPIHLVNAVQDKSTFQSIINFAFQLNEGRKFMKILYKKMDSMKLDTSFHFKMLKKAL